MEKFPIDNDNQNNSGSNEPSNNWNYDNLPPAISPTPPTIDSLLDNASTLESEDNNVEGGKSNKFKIATALGTVAAIAVAAGAYLASNNDDSNNEPKAVSTYSQVDNKPEATTVEPEAVETEEPMITDDKKRNYSRK